MARTLNLGANRLRLMLLMALLLFGALWIGLSSNLPPMRFAGSQPQPASPVVAAPNGASQAPAAASANQPAPASVPIAASQTSTTVIGPPAQMQAPAAPPAAASPVQLAPADGQGCGPNPQPGRDIATCRNP